MRILKDENGHIIRDEAWKLARREVLLAKYADCKTRMRNIEAEMQQHGFTDLVVAQESWISRFWQLIKELIHG